MTDDLRVLLLQDWWRYDPNRIEDWARVYRAFNLLEGVVWCIFGLLVIFRFLRYRKSRIELVYGAAFLTFGASDFIEAYVIGTWLVLLKLINLIALFLLRRIVMRRCYPESKTY